MATHSSMLAWKIPWRCLACCSPWGCTGSATTEAIQQQQQQQHLIWQLYIYKFILQEDLLMFITMSYKNVYSVFLKTLKKMKQNLTVKRKLIKKKRGAACLVVQQLRFHVTTAGGMGLIPGGGTQTTPPLLYGLMNNYEANTYITHTHVEKDNNDSSPEAQVPFPITVLLLSYRDSFFPDSYLLELICLIWQPPATHG